MNMNSTIEYSIIIPVYNSEESLHELADRLIIVVQKLGSSAEILLIDDGSKDKSWKKIEEIVNTNPGLFSGIRLARNYGQHNALLCGFNYGRGNFFITIDDDLQYFPEDIELLITEKNNTGAELVYGMPDQKQHSMIRNFGSNYLSFTSKGNAVKVGGSSFRIIQKNIIQKISERHNNSAVFIDSLFQWYTRSISFVKVRHTQRKYGKSGYRFSKLISMYFNIVINYSAAPLKFMVFLGFIGSLISGLIGSWFIYKKLMYNVPIGFTSIIVSIFFSTGLILFSLGIIGQYLFRIHQNQLNKPAFNVKEILK
jgi:polyisoprenyl-phosphate glycosyltransferase